MMIIFVKKYDENESALASNPILSLVKCLVSIPFVVKEIGVIIPKRTGIHVGTFCCSETDTALDEDAGA